MQTCSCWFRKSRSYVKVKMSFKLSAAESLSSLSLAEDSMSDALDEESLEYSQDFDCAERLEGDQLPEASALKELFIIKKR